MPTTPTTVSEIAEWFRQSSPEESSHMMVVTDTFNYEDYPVFIARGEDAEAIVDEYQNQRRMSKVMEVYSYDLPFEVQVAERRAYFL